MGRLARRAGVGGGEGVDHGVADELTLKLKIGIRFFDRHHRVGFVINCCFITESNPMIRCVQTSQGKK